MPTFIPVYHKSTDNHDKPIYIAKTVEEYKELIQWQESRFFSSVGFFLILIFVVIIIFRRVIS